MRAFLWANEMAGRFSAQINAWATKTKRRTEAVFKESVQRTLEDANTPTAKGGRMRVDTAFLRNSLTAGLNNLPAGPSVRGQDSTGNPGTVSLVIAGAKVTDVIYAGWSAEYAPFRERKDGFREAAVQKWPQTVAKVAEEAKRRFP